MASFLFAARKEVAGICCNRMTKWPPMYLWGQRSSALPDKHQEVQSTLIKDARTDSQEGKKKKIIT